MLKILKIRKKKGKRSKSLRLWNNFENDSLPDGKMAITNLEEGGNKELKGGALHGHDKPTTTVIMTLQLKYGKHYKPLQALMAKYTQDKVNKDRHTDEATKRWLS